MIKSTVCTEEHRQPSGANGFPIPWLHPIRLFITEKHSAQFKVRSQALGSQPVGRGPKVARQASKSGPRPFKEF